VAGDVVRNLEGASPSERLQSAAATGEPISNRYAWFVVIALMLAHVLNYVDRQLPIILIESIKHDLQLTDTQIGLLAGLAFTLAYSIGGVILAFVSDRYSRKWVIVGSLAAWSIFTAVGGLAHNFLHFALARLGVALGESGGVPPAHAMIVEHFPAHRRALPLAVYSAGASIGFMAGLMLGGFINDYANWRVALFMAMPPGLLLALVIAFAVRERPISATVAAAPTEADEPAPGFGDVLRHFARTRSLIVLVCGGGCYSFALGGVTTFLAAFFIRSHGLSTSMVGLLMGLGLGIGAGLGTVLGGYMSDRAGRNDVRLRLWTPAAISSISVPLVVSALLVASPYVAMLLLAFGWVASSSYLAPLTSSVQSLVPSRMRATASAVSLIFTQGIGYSCGALSIGALSDHLLPVAGADSLRYALIAGICVLWLGAALLFVAGRSLPKDLSSQNT
jgi:predicted MFS family arabinose efflux permease